MTVFKAARQVDCLQAAQQLGLQLKRSGSRAFTCCLFHAEKTPSMCLYPGDGGFYCFGCHESGDAIKLYGQALGVTPLEAAKRLCADCGLQYDDKKHYKSVPLAPKPAHMSVHTLRKQIEGWREDCVTAWLARKRTAEATMAALETQYVSAGKDIADLFDDAEWAAALSEVTKAQEAIARLDGMDIQELYMTMKEESHESGRGILSAKPARAG